MTGRHAAPPDEAFDQRERDRAGAHRADVPVPAGPEDLPDAAAAAPPVEAAPPAAAAPPAKKAAAKKAPATKAENPAPSKAASKRAGK